MTVDNRQKPVVDQEKLDLAAQEDEERANQIAEDLENGEEEDENEPPKPPKKEDKEEVDWESKFKESQKEAMVLKARIDKEEEEKTKKIEVTEEFLAAKYPDWEDMTTGEQRAIRKTEILEQEMAEIKNNANKFNNDREWQKKVESFTGEELPDLFPQLVGREEEFQRFATRPTRKGLDLADLAKIFIVDFPGETKKKKSLFHSPGGEGNQPPQKEGMNADDIRILRTTKPLEYMRLVRAGKIKMKI